MEAAQKNAFKIVEWLKNQKSVTKVIYPGLKEHPGYEIMKKQSRGFGAMVTFNVTDEAKAKEEKQEQISFDSFVDSFKI